MDQGTYPTICLFPSSLLHPPTHPPTSPNQQQYISLFNYLNGALQKNELCGLTFENGVTGDEVIESLHLQPLTVWQNLGVICGMVVGFRALAFIFVRKNYTPKPFLLPSVEEKEEKKEGEGGWVEEGRVPLLLPTGNSNSENRTAL